MKKYLIIFAIILGFSYLYSKDKPDNNVNQAIFPIQTIYYDFNKNNSNMMQIFTNGNIYINADEKVGNLLIEDGTVTNYNVNISEYPQAEIIDLKGKTAYPGFNDSHVHLMETSPFIVMGINMGECKNSQDIADSLAANVSKVKEGELMIGVGFSLKDYDAWSPQDLEKINLAAGNRLVFIGDKLGHNAIVNTATINFCNINALTKNPMGGIIGKKGDTLTGMLRESAMTLAGNKLFTMIKKDIIKTTSLQMFRYWASIGYTGIVDLMGAAAGRILYPEIAMELEQEGLLPIRVHYCYTFFKLSEIDSALKYKNINSDMVRFVGCKLFVDGAYAAGQAWTSWKNMKDNNGLYYVYPTDSAGIEYNLYSIVAKLEENGLNCHYHIQGDQGIENLLNALDSVVAMHGILNCLHTIIHSAFITNEQMARIRNFKGSVVMTMQPGFWVVEDNLESYYGEHFYDSYPVKDIIDAGISVGMSTDFTVSPITYCPVSKVIAVAVNGGGKPEHHKPPTMRDMIHGFSYASNATTPSKDLGKLEKGFKADIVVYDNDFYAIPKEQIKADYPKVKSVWIAGKKTFEIPDTVLSVNEYETNEKYEMIYPNPVTSQATIIWDNLFNGRVTIKISDILGTLEKTIYDGSAIIGKQELMFDASEFYSGTYIISISNEKYNSQINALIVK